MDLAIAAGFAGDDGGAIAAKMAADAAGRQHRERVEMDVEDDMLDGITELPNVDDLEVAAAAAAAALEVLAPPSSDEDDDSSEEDSDDESSGSDEDASMEDAPGSSAQHPVRVGIHPDPSDSARVVLTLTIVSGPGLRGRVLAAPAATGPEVEYDSDAMTSSESSEESSSESDSESEGGEPMDYDEMRAMISKAYAAVDEE
eukprot:CAMPEP_0202883978 /NCGR_PEP_ID=MMETSP1391-20130828/40269_1 /ASSEMBLY_ACC=CAM_ASM_000867 /TAXON_ID=1034604 /ORGANISM="Chlamydomonas leiostraca, Strain SAG 11-49" /LENGTH=200 /DNA_ID=CAMNT_0049567079 /DNA_START=34 /DNA_END=633 /DNA_ORIENTATION=+